MSIKRTTRELEKLLARINKLKRASVDSGYTSSSGIHPDYGMSYASLMSFHEYGGKSDKNHYVPPRPVRQRTVEILQHNKSFWDHSIKGYLKGTFSLNTTLNKIGIEMMDTAHSVFGDKVMLQHNSPITQHLKGSRDTPLVDSGSLRDAWTWKVNIK